MSETLYFYCFSAEGLAFMRARNLIHRDLKPQNLLLSHDGPDAVLKIGLFCIVRVILFYFRTRGICLLFALTILSVPFF